VLAHSHPLATRRAGFTTATITLNTNIFGGDGNDTINAIIDGHRAFGTEYLTNTVDGGAGNDHITAYAESEFSGGHSFITNQLFGGSGNDVLDATAKNWNNQTRDHQ
jgi:serralysin